MKYIHLLLGLIITTIYSSANNSLHGNFDYKVLDNKVKIVVKVLNNYNDSTKGGLSISFPQLTNSSRILRSNEYGFDSLKAYPGGSEIWHKHEGKNIYSDYLLVEGWSDKWKDSSEREISLLVDTEGMSSLIVNMRVVLRRGSEEIFLPSDGKVDQQGYDNRQVVIDLDSSSSDNRKTTQYSSSSYKSNSGCSKEKPVLSCSPSEKDTKAFAMCAVAMGGCEVAINELDSSGERIAASQACSLMSSELMGHKHDLNDMLEGFFVDGLAEAAKSSLESDNILINFLGVGLAGGAIVGKAMQLDKCIAQSKKICTKEYNDWKYNCE